MELIFGDKRAQFNEQSSAEDIIEQINDWLNDGDYFSHFQADGQDVYEDPYAYLSERAIEVKVLEVQTKSKDEFVADLLLTAEDYLKNAGALIGGLAEGFAEGSEPELWAGFADFLEGTDWLSQMIGAVDQSSVRPDNWDGALKVSAELEMQIKKMEPFVIREQSKELAGVLKEETVPLFDRLYREVQRAVDHSGHRPHSN